MQFPLLTELSSPADLKSYSLAQLHQLAAELRQYIIHVVAATGGHLASNLGTVELTVALHRVFSSPEDKLIFDVSHQTYSHKLLTGRFDLFPRLRQFKGLCGFANPKESPHDHFFAGHAGTALSLALGVAKNRDLNQRTEHILPILGDASLTCGLTLEALNNVPKDLRRFIVVLNDNRMSISRNVGAMTHILSRFINHPRCNKIYQEIEFLLSKIPGYGKALALQGSRLKESIKNLVSTAPFFEQFNLAYVGPVDGHDLEKLITTLENLQNSTQPVLLHVLTLKGKGMDVAAENPISYHGCKPFDKITGKFLPSSPKPTFPTIFGKHLLKMASKDPSLVAITPAMPAGSCLQEFMDTFPDRCIDVGIAEGHAVTFCAGIAYGKQMKVVCCIYATFLQRAFDNLFHDICLQELPVVFAIDRGGISGPDGSTHHGVYDIAFLNAMPNLVICQPRNADVLKDLMESAFHWQRPVAIRYPNLATYESRPAHFRELGKAEVLHQGSQLALIALGHMSETAMQVKEMLSSKGLEITVIDPVFIKPLDQDLFYQVFSTHSLVVTLEEHTLNGGLGSVINSFILQHRFSEIEVVNLGIPDTFLEHGSQKELLEEISLDPSSIATRILKEFPLLQTLVKSEADLLTTEVVKQ